MIFPWTDVWNFMGILLDACDSDIEISHSITLVRNSLGGFV